jgi:hypothetical protein
MYENPGPKMKISIPVFIEKYILASWLTTAHKLTIRTATRSELYFVSSLATLSSAPAL